MPRDLPVTYGEMKAAESLNLDQMRELRAEIARLTAALRWALGEAPDADGKWFGEVMPEQKDGERLPPWWWRKPLRKLAGMGDLAYDKERRTIVDRSHEQKALPVDCSNDVTPEQVQAIDDLVRPELETGDWQTVESEQSTTEEK